MKPNQRAFIHALAEDFGLDSESVDPEPHRHVVLFKTPKFVSAPMKTLVQAARIRRVQQNGPSTSLSDRADTSESPRRADEAHPPFNGYLLSKPRFALTIDEISTHLSKLPTDLKFETRFLTQRDAIAFFPSTLVSSPPTPPKQTEQSLLRLHPTLDSELIKHHHLGEHIILCSLDATSIASLPPSTDPIILYEQDPSSAPSSTAGSISVGGWSQVAASKSLAPGSRTPPQYTGPAAIGKRPVYTVLGSKLAEHRKKKKEEEEEARLAAAAATQIDSWEDEVLEDEKQDDDDGDVVRTTEEGQAVV